jgi:apolipoprotein N-acyltransferase
MPHWFGYGAVVLLSLYLAIYPAIAAGIAWRLAVEARIGRSDARPAAAAPLLPLILFLAGSWTFTEYLRATLFTGFAWDPLGMIWLPTWAAHGAVLVGTYGLSALAVLTAGALLLAARRAWRPAAVLALPAVLASLAAVLAPPLAETDTRIRVVQPNIGQGEKYSPDAEFRHFAKLAALSGEPRLRPRLLFWPEAAIPAYLDIEPEWRFRLASLLGPNDLLLTGGSKVYFKETDKGLYVDRKLIGARNALWVLTPRGALIGRYDKAHLVPYGEYLPMRSILQPLGLSRLVPGDADFWPGPGPRSLPLPAAGGREPLLMGVQICYEIIFSGQVVDGDHRPAFLFNPSNDAWFGAWGPPQHLAQARMRALEEGLPVIRSTPTGISAVVDAAGRLRQHLDLERAGFIDSRLPPAAAPTPFALLGNFIPLLFALLLLLGGVAIRRMRR